MPSMIEAPASPFCSRRHDRHGTKPTARETKWRFGRVVCA
ncbi:Uncharacterised protein [Mycobacteroides abscessus subsp. abscessus]|nr:Uncharacterised protein [Mycobacteroides abscessus subsp. abscessus]